MYQWHKIILMVTILFNGMISSAYNQTYISSNPVNINAVQASFVNPANTPLSSTSTTIGKNPCMSG